MMKSSLRSPPGRPNQSLGALIWWRGLVRHRRPVRCPAGGPGTNPPGETRSPTEMVSLCYMSAHFLPTAGLFAHYVLCVCVCVCVAAEAIIKSRHGVVRNTDSFFKDDNVETRKITLTPNLLRDDSSSATLRPTEPREVSDALWRTF